LAGAPHCSSAPKIAEFAGAETTFVVASLSALVGIAILLWRRDTLGRFGRFEAVAPTEIEIAEGEGAV
jgi:hypothetical protein